MSKHRPPPSGWFLYAAVCPTPEGKYYIPKEYVDGFPEGTVYMGDTFPVEFMDEDGKPGFEGIFKGLKGAASGIDLKLRQKKDDDA